MIGALHQSVDGSELMATKTKSPLLPALFISGDPNGSVADQIAKLDAAAARLAQLVRDEPDLDRVVDIPDDVARYLDQGVPFTVRFLLLHQIEAPKDLLGRVMSVFNLDQGMRSLGSLVLGASASIFGAPLGIALTAGISLMITTPLFYRLLGRKS